MSDRRESGFSLVEGLVALALLAVSMAILGSILVGSMRANRIQRTQAELQESARMAMSIITQSLRTAGWNPRQVSGFTKLTPTPSGTTAVNQVTINADLNGDGTLNGTDEVIDIRHASDRIEWRRPLVTGANFETLAVDITNDENGDGTAEPMFTLSSATAPRTVVVQITAQSQMRDLQSGEFQRYVVRSTVDLRSAP